MSANHLRQGNGRHSGNDLSIYVEVFPRLTVPSFFVREKLPTVQASLLSVRLFGIVCVTDRPSKPSLQLGAVQDNLLRVYRLDCGEGHDEAPGILHCYHRTFLSPENSFRSLDMSDVTLVS